MVSKYQKRVHTLAWRKVGDFHIAEDITQETFLQVYRKLPTLKDPSQFRGWLYVIANRRCLAWIRKKRVQMQPLEEIDITMAEGRSYSRHVAAEQAESAAETKREFVKNLLTKLKEAIAASDNLTEIIIAFLEVYCDNSRRDGYYLLSFY